jgi:hypothetical protein
MKEEDGNGNCGAQTYSAEAMRLLRRIDQKINNLMTGKPSQGDDAGDDLFIEVHPETRVAALLLKVELPLASWLPRTQGGLPEPPPQSLDQLTASLLREAARTIQDHMPPGQ